jgi:integrase
MRPNRRLKTLPNPSVFKYKDRWVCEYYTFDEVSGKPTAHRKSFVRDLKEDGVEPSVSNQRKAALTFRDQIISKIKESERLERKEREQTYLTIKELKEAKAAFAIFNEIPARNISLVDAVILYRDHLKLAVDTPSLETCVGIFLGRKKEAAESDDQNKRISVETYRTLRQRLGNLLSYFQNELQKPEIKVGEINSSQLVRYFDGLEVSDRTRKNYVTDVANFFNDAADPKDKNRFIHENPMDGVFVYYKKFNSTKSLRTSRNSRVAPAVLQIPDVRRTLDVAFEMREKGLLGFTIAGLFLFMRPSEVFDLCAQENFWDKYFKLEEGIVRIDGFGKMRDQRTITISENCKAWLQFIKDEKLPFCFKKYDNGQNPDYSIFRAKAFLPEKADELIRIRKLYKRGKQPSPKEKGFMDDCQATLQNHQDVLRHTGGTNLYYRSGFDTNLTVAQMGNSSEVFIKHYRGLLAHPDDHEEFWNFHPNQWISNL